jgi:hypothetical protein
MGTNTSAALRLQPRPARAPSRAAPRPLDLARAALGPVVEADVLVASEDGDAAADLAREGARVTVLSLETLDPAGPDGWRSLHLPTWTFDAFLGESLLSRAADLDTVLYRLRTWVRPDAPFAFVDWVAPPAWDASAPQASGALSARDLEVVRRHLPGLRVMRVPAPEPVTSWAEALRTAVEPWLPSVAREVRLAVLSGRFPP